MRRSTDDGRGAQQQPPRDTQGAAIDEHSDDHDEPSAEECKPWSARIRASIARLIEIEGISADVLGAKEVRKRKSWSSPPRNVPWAVGHADAMEGDGTDSARSREYWATLRDVYTSSATKKMRMKEAGAKEGIEQPQPRATAKKKQSGMYRTASPFHDDAGSKDSPAVVQDPEVVKAVERLSDKLPLLLSEWQAASSAAESEPILAAAAAIALEATAMRRCQEDAMERMCELEEHRQHIMHGLLEYSQRKHRAVERKESE